MVGDGGLKRVRGEAIRPTKNKWGFVHAESFLCVEAFFRREDTVIPLFFGVHFCCVPIIAILRVLRVEILYVCSK